MRFTKCLLAGLMLMAITGTLWAAGKEQKTVPAAIRRAGVLKVGVNTDVPKFGVYNNATSEYIGLEIELARLLAREMLGDPNKVAFTPVNLKNRSTLLESKRDGLDLVIATFPRNGDQGKLHSFSVSYFTDNVGFMIKKNSRINDLLDMSGLTFGVAKGTASRRIVKEAADKAGISIRFMEFENYSDIMQALNGGRIDVFAADVAILGGYLDQNTNILSDRQGSELYAVASKLKDKALADYINTIMRRWRQNGTIDRLIAKYELL